MSDSPLGTIGLAATTLYVADLDAALAWYSEKLGLEPASVGSDGHAFAAFSFGGTLIVLEPIEAALEPAARGAENTTVNVMIDRDPADARRLNSSNAAWSAATLSLSGFASFLIRDLDGNRFYVTRPIPKPAK